jgi:hypothetical protein
MFKTAGPVLASRVVVASLVLLFALLPAPGARAEQTPAPAPWGFNGTFGTGGAGGDFSNLFKNPVSWEYDFFRQRGPWRLGIGYPRSSDYISAITGTGQRVFQHLSPRNPQVRLYVALNH